MSSYGLSGTPNVIFDGTDDVGGGFPSGSMFTYYNPYVAGHLNDTTPVLIQAFQAPSGTDINIDATVSLDAPLTGTHMVHFIVCQDGLHGQSNMAIEMLSTELVTISLTGETQAVSRVFDASGLTEAEIEHLRFVVLVQDISSDAIAQGALAAADYAATVNVQCDPAGLTAPWTLEGPGNYMLSSSGSREVFVATAGEYTITWNDVTAWTSPTVPVESLTVAEDETITFVGSYTDGPFSSSVVLGPGNATYEVRLVDYDGDGNVDVHAVNDGEADQLFQSNGDGSFTNIAAGLIADSGAGRTASWADVNEDGHPDVFVAKYNEGSIMLAGDGAGGFTSAVGGALGDPSTAEDAEFVDYDLDGLVDLYVVNYNEANVTFKNYGIFGDVVAYSPSSGGLLGNTGPGTAGTWIDYNLDGRMDCYLVQYNAPNIMFENTDLGIETNTSTGTNDRAGGLGAAWGDHDNDGDFDMFLANDDVDCRLYRNSGLAFGSTAVAALTDRGGSTGAEWGDFDNDTNLDLYIIRSNGADRLLLGNGAGEFSEILPGEAPVISANTSLACGDIDRDGQLDVVLGSPTGGSAVLFNDMAGDNHWVEFDLTGVTCPVDAIGARLVLTADGITQMRMVKAASGANGNLVHFGLGATTSITELAIHWPDGTTQVETNFVGDRVWDIVQGETLETPVGDENLPQVTALGKAYPNPFNPMTTIGFALAGDTHARIDVYTVDGRLLKTLADRPMSAGRHLVTWNGTDRTGRPVASGTYLYKLSTSNGFSESGRMALLK